MSTAPPDAAPSVSTAPNLARNARLLSLGNIASRVFGLVREMVIASLFGASGEVSAFRIAAQAPTMLYDLLVGGMLSAALVPVLSDYAQRDRRSFLRLVYLLGVIFAIGLAVLTVVLMVTAPALPGLLAVGFREQHPELLGLTTQLIRWSAPLVWLLGMAGLLTAILFAQGRFSFPALATAVYNLGIVLAAPLLAARFGVTALVIGLLAGGLAQLWLLCADVWRSGVFLRVQWVWHHPALYKILRLYAPIAAGMVVSLFQIGWDRRLASGTGEQSIAWMANATTLQQMPLGLISVAIALAALPQLSQHHAAQDERSYRATLGRGLRMVLLLMLPAAVGLWLLGAPLTRFLFEGEAFTPADTDAVVRALSIYVVGMLFAAIDFPLNYAFYARNDTISPAVVGVVSVIIYGVVALLLIRPLGYLGLVWADSAKQAGHALIMLGLLSRVVGRVPLRSVVALWPIGAAALAMGAIIALLNALLGLWLPHGRVADLALLVVSGGVGSLLYGLILHRLGVAEVTMLGAYLRRRISI
jgi:putative peptidoglycan lipid II flippase